MIFNIWRPYPLIEPRTEGWYQVTLVDGTVMDLYFLEWQGAWMDERRQSVFKGYKVYHSGRAPMEETRVYDDKLCNRTSEVKAWRKIDNGFGWWWKTNRSKEE